MKVLFLVPREDKASTRYRILQYLPYLEKQRIAYEVLSLSGTSRWKNSLWNRLRNADVVCVQKKLFSPVELFLVRRASQRLVYDFDDSVMYKSGAASAGQVARQGRRFAGTAKTADLIVAGNRYLQHKALQYNDAVEVLPTALDMSRYVEKGARQERSNGVVLGWIGSKGTLRYLRDLVPALEDLGRACPGVKLKIVADDFLDLQNVEVIKKPWTSEDEITDLHSFDIGLMPLSDDVWTRGKCGFKLLQCMAVGLPVVCSPVGVNAEIVTDGVEGFWATSRDEWTARLKSLVLNGNQRAEMGRKARSKVLQEYALDVTAPRFLRYLQGQRHGGRLS